MFNIPASDQCKGSMKEIDELIKQYGLEEDLEHVIIPFTDKNGRQKKRYLLKRRFIRLVYADGFFVDYPLSDVIMASIKYPELLLSEALLLMGKGYNPELNGIKPGPRDRIIIRRMQTGEEYQVSSLVQEVFSETVAALYSERGNQEFLKYIAPEAVHARSVKDHVVYVAEDKMLKKIVGILEIENSQHITLMFVGKVYQHKGIGRLLMEKARMSGMENSVHELTVDSSPNAVGAYESFGFMILDAEKEKNGMRYVPMKLVL
jgi:GNAT superfamily N-acetyltransferase